MNSPNRTFPCRLEQGIHNTERVRDTASGRYKDLKIPWEWMLDSGIISQVCRIPKLLSPFVLSQPRIIEILLVHGACPYATLIKQLKTASLKLAKEYMNRIANTLKSDPFANDEELLLQGVRFAFRIHQVTVPNYEITPLQWHLRKLIN